MPRKAKSKDEIEVVFGLKQVLGLAILVALVLGGTYFWGFETGHKRALLGQPSLLAFLASGARIPPETVAIPDVLLEPIEESGRILEEPARPSSEPVSTATETESATGRPAASQLKERVKPKPSVQAKPEGPEAVAPKPEAVPVPDPNVPAPAKKRERPTSDSNGRLHYQIAALSERTNAKQLVDWLRIEGFQAKIQPANDDGLFRVYVGPFRNDADAVSAKDRLTKGGFTLMARKF